MTRTHRPPASANPAPRTVLNRRGFLKGSALAGCSAAAWPLLTPVTLAAAPGENRLVVIILRGAMDGLDALRPVGDPDFRTLRDPSALAKGAPVPLDGMFALHPALAPLSGMWQAGELGFAHAVATPYRDKR
ncbi:MAG TPA: twin-arginine translocation signal domain-containing protein, partial [Aliiroseovarius sp.]|nr:twin-arginine translocation signal domain-containing protein [Aliiroseovarius sp.]